MLYTLPPKLGPSLPFLVPRGSSTSARRQPRRTGATQWYLCAWKTKMSRKLKSWTWAHNWIRTQNRKNCCRWHSVTRGLERAIRLQGSEFASLEVLAWLLGTEAVASAAMRANQPRPATTCYEFRVTAPWLLLDKTQHKERPRSQGCPCRNAEGLESLGRAPPSTGSIRVSHMREAVPAHATPPRGPEQKRLHPNAPPRLQVVARLCHSRSLKHALRPPASAPPALVAASAREAPRTSGRVLRSLRLPFFFRGMRKSMHAGTHTLPRARTVRDRPRVSVLDTAFWWYH